MKKPKTIVTPYAWVQRFAASIALFALLAQTAFSATWYVDTNADSDPNTCVADESDNDDDCTLRDALSQVGENDTIRFLEDVTISLGAGGQLPTIANNGVTINASIDARTVQIDGGGGAYDGLKISGDGVTVDGLSIYGYLGGAGINVSGGDASVIQNNEIGIKADGSTVSGNQNGIVTAGTNLTIANNVISGNTGAPDASGATGNGIYITGGSDIRIVGNKIGTDSAGTAEKGNYYSGIHVGDGVNLDGAVADGGVADGLQIGGDAAGGSERNIISGNGIDGSSDGITFGVFGETSDISGTANITNNYIGVNSTGNTALARGAADTGNGRFGINVEAGVGTSMDLNITNNVISGQSDFSGVYVGDSDDLVFQGNKVGVGADGTTAIANGDSGSEVGTGVTLNGKTILVGTDGDGTSDAAEANIIANNATTGLEIFNSNGRTTDSITIAGNTIKDNRWNGIEVNHSGATALTIGGDASAETNLVGGNNSSSGNTGQIIVMDANGSVTVQGNLVGFEPDGTTADASNGIGISVSPNNGSISSITIGAPTGSDGTNAANLRNVVGNTTGVGVRVGDPTFIPFGNVGSNVTIAGNYIGVDINGTGAAGNTTGDQILINSLGTTMNLTVGGDIAAEGNVIGNAQDDGIDIVDLGGSFGGTSGTLTIQNNKIGVDATGAGAESNGGDGVVLVDAGAVTISDNTISNAGGYGVNISDAAAGSNTYGPSTITITGNEIGTNAAGTADMGNGAGGVYIDDDDISGTITIGGDNIGNTISGNTGDAIKIGSLVSQAVNVLGNYLGIGSDGATSLANTGSGVDYLGSGTLTVGGDNDLGEATPRIGEGNVISNNASGGIMVGDVSIGSDDSPATVNIYGNVIGLKQSGAGSTQYTGDAGNTGAGVHIYNSVTTTLNIGAAGASKRNYISGNSTHGILVDDTGSNPTINIKNNYIGVGEDGSTKVANDNTGVTIQSSDTTTLNLGGVGVAGNPEGNVIAGNTNSGVLLFNSNLTSTILANYFGISADGTTGIAGDGGSSSLDLTDGTHTIGNGGASGRNVISGNNAASGVGVDVQGGTATIIGNYIGTNSSGTAAVGNDQGVRVAGGTGNIGDGTEGGRNIISGNGSSLASGGVIVAGGTANIYGNYIGTNAAGTSAIANKHGIRVSAGTANIGDGISSGSRNVIAGNTESGIGVLNSSTANIYGNYIGVDSTGNAALGNGQDAFVSSVLNYGGIAITGLSFMGFNLYPSVTIGGGDVTDAAKRNVISGNYGHGIGITGAKPAGAAGQVIIAGNYIGVGADGTTDVGNVDGSHSLADLNGSGIVAYDRGGLEVDSLQIGGSSAAARNVISGNDGNGISIMHSVEAGNAGTGQDWSSGYIYNNYIGYAADGTTSLANSGRGIFVDPQSTSNITGLNIGASATPNLINVTDQVGIYLKDITPGNLTSLNSHNTFPTCSATSFVEQYAGALASFVVGTACEAAVNTAISGASSGGGGGSSSSGSAGSLSQANVLGAGSDDSGGGEEGGEATGSSEEQETGSQEEAGGEATSEESEEPAAEEVVEEKEEEPQEEVKEEPIPDINEVVEKKDIQQEVEKEILLQTVNPVSEKISDVVEEILEPEPEVKTTFEEPKEEIFQEELDKKIQEEIDLAKKKLEEEEQEKEPEPKPKTQEQEKIEKSLDQLEKLDEKIVNNKLSETDKEVVEELKEEIEQTFKKVIDEGLKERTTKGLQEKVVVNTGGKKTEIDPKKEVKIVVALTEEEEEKVKEEIKKAEEEKPPAQKDKEEVIVVNTSTTVDGVSALLALKEGVNPFVPPEDGVPLKDKSFFNESLDKKYTEEEKKELYNSPGKLHIDGGKFYSPKFVIPVSGKDGSKFDMWAVNTETKERIFLGSEFIGGNKAAIAGELDFEGKFLITLTGENGIIDSAFMNIKFDDDQNRSPRIGIGLSNEDLVGYDDEQGFREGGFDRYDDEQGFREGGIDRYDDEQGFRQGQINAFGFEPVKKQEVAQADTKQARVIGVYTGKPFAETKFVWKSITLSSVVIADANGYAEVEVPIEELREQEEAFRSQFADLGDFDDEHEVIAYTVDKESGWSSSFARLFFRD